MGQSGAARRGIARERAVVALLKEEGFVAFRAPASLGVADVVALKKGSHSLFLEIKSTKAGPYHSFGPDARQRLSAAAEQAGAVAQLGWWPPHGELRFFGEAEWPS